MKSFWVAVAITLFTLFFIEIRNLELGSENLLVALNAYDPPPSPPNNPDAPPPPPPDSFKNV